MTNNRQAEFPNEAGTFSMEDSADLSVFNVSGNEDRTLLPICVPAIETPPMATPPVRQASSRSTRRVLVTVHVIRAEIMLDTGKPSNIHRYNMTVHVNIYHEEDATIPYILEKVMESMDEENLVVVGPNGLILYDQEGTRGSIVSVTIYVKIYYRFDGKLPLKHKFNFSS